jgi:hypothetical protein
VIKPAPSLALLVALSLTDSVGVADSQCMRDDDCAGEAICLRGACKTPRLWELFPPTSTPSPDQDRYVIKTTSSQCRIRKGQSSPKLGGDSQDKIRCLLPRGVVPAASAPQAR